MTELERSQKTLQTSPELKAEYLKILDSLMTDGEITAEMKSVAAKKLGFSITAAEFAKLSAPTGCDTAPDGKTVGCPCGEYLTWTDYWIRNKDDLCPKGGKHEPEDGSGGKVCKKCRLGLCERGVLELYDRYGNELA
ncbi:hypothetical protein [Ruminococcus sp.]|uniref:hypothetical protein n=1 Tax=Ruminococcus sp. TaxID=41978 RepID=UPI0025DAAF47|nr:hypothetical protein [Ruminococcus sp.]MBQ8967173.1 hypothetical protein [Ruminococcus sp.]